MAQSVGKLIQIDLEMSIPQFRGGRGKVGRLENGGAVYQDIYLTEGFDRARYDSPDGFLVRQVRPKSNRVAAPLPYVRHHLLRCFRRPCVVDDDARALVGQCKRQRPSHAALASGYDGNFPLKFHST